MTGSASWSDSADLARKLETAGFSGLLYTETSNIPWMQITAAAMAAPGLSFSTGIAVAFPRSPMIAAAAAYEIAANTDGHFRLGLGSQVKAHVERRYGVEYDRPAARMRDYVAAVQACWRAFSGTERLAHAGEFYELSLLPPDWAPRAHDHPMRVDISAVGPMMLRMAGEVADGVHVHPIGEPGYLERHVLPRLADGAIRANRPAGEIDVIVPVTTIVGDNDEQREASRELARTSLSFYGSTPNYAFIWDEAGFEGTTERIRAKQKAGDFDGMAAEITDDHLDAFCTEGEWDDLADRLIETYGGTADRLVLYSAGTADPDTLVRYGSVAAEISARTAS